MVEKTMELSDSLNNRFLVVQVDEKLCILISSEDNMALGEIV